VPDISTKQLLFSTSPYPMFITKIAQVGASGTAYMLDRRCQEIWRVTDQDGDGFPEQIDSTPYASSANITELSEVAGLFATSSGDVYIFDNGDYRFVGDTPTDPDLYSQTSVSKLVDTDSDGSADDTETHTTAINTPVLPIEPFAGLTSLQVSGPSGKTAQIYELSAGDVPGQLLGAATIPTGGITSVALSRALSQGERIKIRFTGADYAATHRWVRPAWPQVSDATPSIVGLQGGPVSVIGANLLPGTVFRLVRMNDPTQTVTLSATVASSTQATVAIPPLAASWKGHHFLSVHDPLDSNSIGESVIDVAIR
jgi:hypothetical protein